MEQVKNERCQLYHGDCLEVMDQLIAQGVKVDAIICDPPYGTVACSWDNVIPFNEMWGRLEKLIKEDGAIVLFGSQPFTSLLIQSKPEWFREEIIWLKNKAGSGLQAKQKHLKTHENIIVFSKKGKYTFNPQKWLVDKKEFLTQRKTFNEVEVGNNIYSGMKRVQSGDDGTRNPISIVSCRVPFTPSKSKTYSSDVDIRVHPTQKPLELMEYLAKTFSNENETILDFTMGSGSTIVAALNTNRKAIGIELDKNYYDIAKTRIEETMIHNK